MPSTYPFGHTPRPTITRDVGETSVEFRTSGGTVKRFHVSNPSADTVVWFKAWDVRSADLNTSTSRMLFDHPIPAGGTLLIQDLPLSTGLTVRVTNASGAANVDAPDADAICHDWNLV